MADPPRDWDKELAEIDKLMGKAPAPSPVPAQAPAPRGAAPAARASGAGASSVAPAGAPASRRTVAGAWARALAGAVLAGAMTQWPYAHGCGGGLLLYGIAAVTLVVVGVWGAAATWRSRLAAAHVLSLIVAGWGFGLVAAIVLPRIGYAAEAMTWLCP